MARVHRLSTPFMRSVLIGVLSTGIDLLALSLLIGAGLSPRVANVPALLAGLAMQFVGNKWFAFRDRSRRLVRQGAAFALVETVALTGNAAAFDLLVTQTPLSPLVARLIGSAVVYLAISYPMWRLIFRNPEEVPRCSSRS